jgi:hypothetical protein
MKHILLLSILLAPSAIHAMEAVLTHKEIVTYKLATLLDRQDRMSLKLTHSALYAIIVPQHIINEHYQSACLKNNTKAIHELRRQGALNPDEEVYKLFLDNKQKIAIEIISHSHHGISAVFSYGVKKNNINFMQWLLDTKKPRFDSYLLEGSLTRSKQLKHREITQLFESYIENQREKDWDRTMNTVISSPDPIEYIQYDNAGEQNCIIS